MSTLFVDYMAGRSEWKRCPVDEIEMHRTEVDF